MASQIKTKKQQVKLPHGGHLYTFDKMSVDGATKFWRCEFKDSVNKCKGRIWTDLNNHFIRLATPHTCPANASNVEAQKVKTTIKHRAITTLAPPSVIRSETLQNVPSPAALLVTKRAPNDLIKRARHEINARTAVPTNVNFEIGQAYRTYTSSDGVEELFLLGDSGVYFENGNENPQRVLLFGRESFGRFADRMNECFGDGTFSLAPAQFYQIYTILAKREKWIFPVCHASLTSKSQTSYERMFTLLRAAWPNFAPIAFSVDFEMPCQMPLRQSFPDARSGFAFFILYGIYKRK